MAISSSIAISSSSLLVAAAIASSSTLLKPCIPFRSRRNTSFFSCTIRPRSRNSLPSCTAAAAASSFHMAHTHLDSKLQAKEINFTKKGESKEIAHIVELFPPIEPYKSGFLDVSDLHSLYWEESGNPNGQPIVFLHGGPGSGTSSGNRRFFDPNFFRIILFDQRGAGKSTPHACLEDNTTWHLVDDIEKVREHLKIEKWLVFGGSWGSTLALTYCQSHADRITGIILRGIFLLRKKEIDWFYQGPGTSAIFPDAWEPYRDFIPDDERSDFVTAYGKRLNSDDLDTQLAAAKAWTNWEMATSHLIPNEESMRRAESEEFALAFARIENHYFRHKGFFPSDSFLIDNVHKIKHLPAIIVQGRYDVVCPMMSAWDLHKAWPEAQFKVIPNAGHSANEIGITKELLAATEGFKYLFQDKGQP
ncbi:hypothetical protein O6H91_13G073800 [Diphasiastrum complanatum]|nr:hypothetical protein O6H91_13G073800 [Diphasiastrum complanatum]